MPAATGDWLFLPGGVTQLLSLVAAYRSLGEDANIKCNVLSVCYFINDLMLAAMEEASKAFGWDYLGNLEPTRFTGFPTSAYSVVRRPHKWLFPRTCARRLLRRNGFPPLDRVYGMGFTLRPWVFDEVLISAILKPDQHLCVLDGMNPKSPNRQLEGMRWRGLQTPFNNIPGRMDVWCPSDLVSEAAALGRPREISSSATEAVNRQYRETALAKSFQHYLQEKLDSSRSAVLFSQQLSSNGYCSAFGEATYYFTVTQRLLAEGYRRILIKPHPRDDPAKVRHLQRLFERQSSITIVPDRFLPVPFEPFADILSERTHSAFSTNSTALLTYRACTGRPAVAFDSTEFSDEFRKDLRQYCLRHSIALVLL
ncbi:MAG TPA: polysialyltransferase family glycosyltransferase [Tepidisphaeraceae bacterium]|nr:polysialyltransferase family glycosyltransferase [Tepidisphaeraceae bacterium]